MVFNSFKKEIAKNNAKLRFLVIYLGRNKIFFKFLHIGIKIILQYDISPKNQSEKVGIGFVYLPDLAFNLFAYYYNHQIKAVVLSNHIKNLKLIWAFDSLQN